MLLADMTRRELDDLDHDIERGREAARDASSFLRSLPLASRRVWFDDTLNALDRALRPPKGLTAYKLIRRKPDTRYDHEKGYLRYNPPVFRNEVAERLKMLLNNRKAAESALAYLTAHGHSYPSLVKDLTAVIAIPLGTGVYKLVLKSENVIKARQPKRETTC